MNLSKWLHRNPAQAAIVAGIGISTMLSSGNILQNASQINQVKAITQSNALQQMKLQAGEQAAKQRAKIAEGRYQAGCIVVVAQSDPSSFTSLSEDRPVIDAVRKTPLPAGSVVCDVLGNTGVIANKEVDADGDGKASLYPVVSDLAFTGNRAIVDTAKARVSARFRVPNQ